MKRLLLSIVAMASAIFSGLAQEREVVIACDWGDISATLSTPAEGSDVAVLIVAGSGPTDRNGNSGQALNTYAYKMLSDDLVKGGVAVMRYDKRAIGRSSLNDPTTIPSLTFDDFVDDAVRCVDYLRSEGFKRVIVAGHSEGGEIALHMALRDDVVVDGLVLLCCPGFAMDQILTAQLSAQLVPQYMGLMATATNIMKRIKRGEMVPAENIPQELISLFHPSVQRFLCSSMAFDPAELMSRVEQPTLIISGGRDIQVAKSNAERLVSKAKNGTHLHFEQMTHILKDADTNDRIQQLLGVYTNANLALTEGVSDAVLDFAKR